MDRQIMTENPLLLPLNKEKTVYDGFITVQVCKLADWFLHTVFCIVGQFTKIACSYSTYR